MRETSIESYLKINDEVLLSEKRLMVYEYLFINGPLTQREAVEGMAKNRNDQAAIVPRFAELLRHGVIKIVGYRVNAATGKRAILWDVTSAIPVKLEKKAPLKKQIIDLIAEVSDLKSKLALIEGKVKKL